jgi:hypothetical protein
MNNDCEIRIDGSLGEDVQRPNTAACYKAVCQETAKLFTGRDWHQLTTLEKNVVSALTDLGFLERNIPPNGFVGRIL